ncbi:hypothetical protein [Streptomyces sp. NPDC007205]|uniref:hypothetical protein n=1 Tax=Streptomyces sp. NPDC007205 TaxID=3154316 RepID=UPI0033F0B1C6
MTLSDDLSSDSARIVIRLPLSWPGSDKGRAMLAHVIHSRLPGEWVVAYLQQGLDPYVEYTPKPPVPPEPELPRLVAWIPSVDPARVYVGATFKGPRYVDTETETPHGDFRWHRRRQDHGSAHSGGARSAARGRRRLHHDEGRAGLVRTRAEVLRGSLTGKPRNQLSEVLGA